MMTKNIPQLYETQKTWKAKLKHVSEADLANNDVDPKINNKTIKKKATQKHHIKSKRYNAK